MYKVLLYFGFGTIYATVNEVPGGDILTFDTLEQAERYGATKGMPYEAVEVRL